MGKLQDNSQEPLPTSKPQPYQLPDMSVGNPNNLNPLEALSWEELRDLIYGECEGKPGFLN